MGEDTEVQRSNLPEVTRLEQSSGLPAPSLTFLALRKTPAAHLVVVGTTGKSKLL